MASWKDVLRGREEGMACADPRAGYINVQTDVEGGYRIDGGLNGKKVEARALSESAVDRVLEEACVNPRDGWHWLKGM